MPGEHFTMISKDMFTWTLLICFSLRLLTLTDKECPDTDHDKQSRPDKNSTATCSRALSCQLRLFCIRPAYSCTPPTPLPISFYISNGVLCPSHISAYAAVGGSMDLIGLLSANEHKYPFCHQPCNIAWMVTSLTVQKQFSGLAKVPDLKAFWESVIPTQIRWSKQRRRWRACYR